MTANANTDVDQAGSAANIAGAVAQGVVAATQTGAAQDSSQSFQRDYSGVSARVSDNDKDVGADERYEATGPDNWDIGYMNKKRTTDQYQTLDTQAILNARLEEKIERERSRTWDDREQQLRLRHIDAEFNQRMRHADFQVTALAAVTKEMVETISDRVADKVCARMGK